MNYENRFMMNEAVLLLAYAWALSGYLNAAVWAGLCSSFLAVWWHSPNRLYDNFSRIVCGTVIQLLFILVSGFEELEGTMAVLAFCNTIVSILWMESSKKAVRRPMMILTSVFPLFLLLSIIMGKSVQLFLFGTLREPYILVMITLLIFGPVQYAWFKKLTKRSRSVLPRSM